MADDRWRIEREFRDGNARTRNSDGSYQSVSTAIMEEISEFEEFNESELAERLDVDEQVVTEHLEHLEDKGLVEEKHGYWCRDFEDRGYPTSEAQEHEFPWEQSNADDESIY